MSKCNGVGWTEFGPFVGFRYSTDYGKTWTETSSSPSNPLFGENPEVDKVKIGAPHFVDFGKNMQHSPDGYAYLVAHGSDRKDAWNNWIQADNIYLIRVKPSIETMNDRNSYQFFSGYDKNKNPIWQNDFSKISPLLTWENNLGCTTITYNESLGRYLMCVTRGVSTTSGNSILLESKNLTGPWSIVQYLEDFGPFAYFLNIPSKFISSDGLSMWLLLSANFAEKTSAGSPIGARYSLSLHEFHLNK